MQLGKTYFSFFSAHMKKWRHWFNFFLFGVYRKEKNEKRKINGYSWNLKEILHQDVKIQQQQQQYVLELQKQQQILIEIIWKKKGKFPKFFHSKCGGECHIWIHIPIRGWN